MTSRTHSVMGTFDERVYVAAAALLLSLGAGAAAAHVDLIWVGAVMLALVAVAMVASRVATLWFVVLSGLILTGVAQLYVPGAGYLRYLPALAATGLLLHVTADLLPRRSWTPPATVTAFLVFLGIGLLSIAANWASVGMAVIGLKSYYPMWTLFLGLAICHWRPAVIDSLPRAALLIALLQLPFVVQQFLVFVPLRESAWVPGLVAVDIIAGTFGGTLYGGGANAVLSLFLITVCACLLGMWRQSALSGSAAMVTIALLLLPVMLNSSRVALLYLPIVFLTIFFSEVVRQPLKFLGGLVLVAALTFGMLMSYTVISQTPGTDSWQTLLSDTLEAQLATEQERSDQYSTLSRWTVLTFWAERHGPMEPIPLLIGHGPGATRVQLDSVGLAQTLAETKYGGVQIGYTAVAALLWEVGVLGLLAVLWIFFAAFRAAGRISAHHARTDPMKSGIALGLRASIVMLTLSLAHKDFFVFHIPYQTFVILVFGWLAAQLNQLDETNQTNATNASDQNVARLTDHLSADAPRHA